MTILLHMFFFLSKAGAYISHNAPQPLSDITGGNLSDYAQLQKTYFCYYFIYTHVACIYTLGPASTGVRCKIGEITL